jgi:hypothetical protein
MTAGDSYNDPIKYKGYLIYQNDFTAHPDWADVSWLYIHEDYDGPEDNRAGVHSSVDLCKQEIDWLEEDNG